MRQKIATTPQQAIDGLATALFIPILAISVPSIAGADYVLAMLITLGPLVWYVVTVVLAPLRASRSINRPDIAQLIGDDRVRFRAGAGALTCAVDLGFRKYIIFNEQDLAGHYQDWKALIGHEYAHIRNGDAKFFHFVGIFGITTFFAVVYSLIASFVLLSNGLSGAVVEASSSNGPIILILALIGFPIFFLLWIRQSLHAREFRADGESRALDKKAFDDWMRRSLRREIRESAPSGVSLRGVLRWFTHPSFKRRADALQDNKLASNYRIHSEVLRSLVFVTGGAALSYFVFMAVSSFASQAEHVPVWLVPIFVLLMAMPLCAAYGAISVSAMHSFEQGGWRGSIGFCIAVAVANWLLLAAFYYSAVLLGQYAAVTKGFPSAPPELMSTGSWPFFVMLFNFGIVLSAVTMVAFRIFGRFRYSLIVHLIVGPSSLIGGLLATKLEWWLFT